MVGAAGAAIGPLIGGALLEHFWWGSVFLINVPLMLQVIPMAWGLLPDAQAAPPLRPWPIGQAVLLVAGVISTVYALKAPGSGSLSMPALALLLVAGVALVARFAYLQATVNAPMLDLRLVTNPILLAGIIMAMVASGALAGVKLTLAQGPQYVLGKTPLQAGMFMLPIMVAAGIGGPLAGWLSNRFGLRAVASASLPSAAITRIGLSLCDFSQGGWLFPTLPAGLGLTSSIGLTASSIAIMSTVAAADGGAGEVFVAAEAMGGDSARQAMDAAGQAFTVAHSSLLLTSGVLMTALAITVFFLLDRKTASL